MKTCTQCEEEKPLSEYRKDKNQSSGLRPECKACCSARDKAYRQTPAGKKAQKEGFARYSAKPANRRKRTIRQRVLNALKDGRIKKADGCESCGSTDKLEAHHPSYAGGMELCVTWLCQPCHKAAHAAGG